MNQILTETLRHLDGHALDDALRDCRQETLTIFADFERQLSQQNLRVPLRPEINPPLWEFGHVFWFSQYWLARNPLRAQGVEPTRPIERSLPAAEPDLDGLYNSAILAHDDRWSASLWGFDQVCQALRDEDEARRALLAQDLATAPVTSPHRRYFYRLVLAHELMHQEAFRLTARLLQINLTTPIQPAKSVTEPVERLQIHRQALGGLLPPRDAFAFDNEYGDEGLRLETDGFEIDAQLVSQSDYQRFCEETGRPLVTHTPADGPAMYLSLFDAQAYCDWLGDGHRLPTETEWVLASLDPRFQWGQVWEWTSSVFAPFSGFRAHPYREYSEPWFDGSHQVVKGASSWTHPLMVSRRYRNFFQGHRADVRVGFRVVRPVS